MLVSYSKSCHGPGPHSGRELETPDGVRWTVGDRTDYQASEYSETHTYRVTTPAKTTLDCDGKRRKVAPSSMRADYFEDGWTIERVYGDTPTEWHVAAVETLDSILDRLEAEHNRIDARARKLEPAQLAACKPAYMAQWRAYFKERQATLTTGHCRQSRRTHTNRAWIALELLEQTVIEASR